MSDIRDQNGIVWWSREELVAEIERLRVENAGMTEAVAVLRAIVEAIDRREPKITGWLERARAALEGKP